MMHRPGEGTARPFPPRGRRGQPSPAVRETFSVETPGALVEAVRRGEAVLFAGSGVSNRAVRVGTKELREAIGGEIRKDYSSYDCGSRSLEDICDEFAALYGRESLVHRLACMIPRDVPPLSTHLAAVRSFRSIVTTNWDLLFEAACARCGLSRPVLAAESDAPLYLPGSPVLLKIHGSVDRPETIVCTTDDYERFADSRSLVSKLMSNLLYGNVVLFAGYGLRDEHVRRLLSRLRRLDGQEVGRRMFAVGHYDEVRARLLASRGMEVIRADAEAFLPLLARAAGTG